jgi:malonyl-CoA O-methyltransferase
MTDTAQSLRIVPTRHGYDAWAAHYDGEGNPLVELEEPEVDRLLGDLDGRSVLDVGCGTGRHAHRLARAGAQVTAIDFSAGMLARARTKAGADRIRFLEHDLTARLPFDDAQFDRVVCGLVLDHIPDLTALLRELKRVCARDGFAVATIMHPAMMLKGVQARFKDPATGEEIRPESCPHQMSDYVMAAVRAGFTIDHVGESSPTEALAARVPRAARYVGWPLLLAFKLLP